MFTTRLSRLMPTMAAAVLTLVTAGFTLAQDAPKDNPDTTNPTARPRTAPTRDTGTTTGNRPERPVRPTTPEEIQKRIQDARDGRSIPPASPANAPVGASISAIPEGDDDRPPAIRFEPLTADFGDMVIDEPETMTIKLCNILDVPIRITRAVASCGCTAVETPKEPIAPGACGETTIKLSPGSRAPTTLHKKVTFQIEGQPSATIQVLGNVVAYVMIEPSILSAPSDTELSSASDGILKLTSGDGTPFKVLSVVPAVVTNLDIEAPAALEHTLYLSWQEYSKNAKPVKVTIRTDHPKGPSVPLMIRRSATERTAPVADSARPTVALNNISTTIRTGDLAQIKQAIELNQSQLNEADRLGKYPIHWAVDSTKPEVVKALIEAGANVNVGDKAGQPPLTIAVDKGNLEVVKLLLAAGADLKATDHIGGTPLLWAAARAKDPEILKTLIAAGGEVNIRDTNGWTPLHWAAAIGEPANVKILLEKSVDVNAVDGMTAETALMRAVKTGKPETVKLLLEAGADVNKVNHLGQTALLMAAEKAPLERVKMLIEAKAKLDVRDRMGKSAWNLAKERAESDSQKELVIEYLGKVLPDVAKADAPSRPQPVITPTGN